MATHKSNQSRGKTPISTIAADGAEMVSVPFLPQPYSKAPAVDPYLKSGTIKATTISFGGVSLPPIQSGIEPSHDLNGETTDIAVDVMWVTRRQIDSILSAIGREKPELKLVLAIVRKYLATLDSVRGEIGYSLSLGKGWLRRENPDIKMALDQLNTASALVGNWNDARRLYIS